jgi:hypothetical protein
MAKWTQVGNKRARRAFTSAQAIKCILFEPVQPSASSLQLNQVQFSAVHAGCIRIFFDLSVCTHRAHAAFHLIEKTELSLITVILPR